MPQLGVLKSYIFTEFVQILSRVICEIFVLEIH